jgi:hypothetical protein
MLLFVMEQLNHVYVVPYTKEHIQRKRLERMLTPHKVMAVTTGLVEVTHGY